MSRRFAKDPSVDRALRHSVRDGVAYSVMAGAGETYFSAFAIFFKATTLDHKIINHSMKNCSVIKFFISNSH